MEMTAERYRILSAKILSSQQNTYSFTFCHCEALSAAKPFICRQLLSSKRAAPFTRSKPASASFQFVFWSRILPAKRICHLSHVGSRNCFLPVDPQWCYLKRPRSITKMSAQRGPFSHPNNARTCSNHTSLLLHRQWHQRLPLLEKECPNRCDLSPVPKYTFSSSS